MAATRGTELKQPLIQSFFNKKPEIEKDSIRNVFSRDTKPIDTISVENDLDARKLTLAVSQDSQKNVMTNSEQIKDDAPDAVSEYGLDKSGDMNKCGYGEEGGEEETFKVLIRHRRKSIFSDDECASDTNKCSREEEEEVVKVVTRHRKRRIISDDEHTCDSDDMSRKSLVSPKETSEDNTTKKQRRLTRKRDKTSHNESEEIRNELEFLEDNDVYEKRARPVRESQYSLSLRKLKNRKQRLNSFNGMEGPLKQYYYDEREYESGSSDSANSYQKSDNKNESDEENSCDGFIVDDDIIDGEKVDVTDEMDTVLPEQFSMANMRSSSHNFHLFVEYLIRDIRVSNIPAARNFHTAIRSIERRVISYRDSAVTSDAWNSSFKDCLDNYSRWCWKSLSCPEVACTACRGNKPSSSDVVFVDPLSKNLPNEIIFSVGSECYRRGRVYHRLTHLKQHMRQQIQDEMKQVISSLPDSAIGVEEEQLITQIMESMESSRFIEKLYQGMNSLLESHLDNNSEY
ncbi:hypothetical protein BDF14DRAFT_1819655 [Spinellus fusiger]|nr:hypothetical protein BDF14DRAFT_1819655 [Spinellus fusiger]